MKALILLIVFVLSCLPANSQWLKIINIKEIPQKKVRKYIVSRSIDQMHDFSSIHASWKKDIDEADFNIIEKTFFLKFKLADVWECYRNVNPVEMWSGQSVSFGLLITKCSKSVIYTNNKTSLELDTGQVFFLNIRMMNGLLNVPVAFEIINIDQQKKIVEFSYIDNNKSRGKQTIQFFDNGDGRTRITHRSYFKSSSALRDDLFYPYFHKKFVKEFHWNMRQLIKNKSTLTHM